MTNEGRLLERSFRWLYTFFAVLAVAFAVNQIFDFQFFAGIILFGPSYNFLIVGFLISLVFIFKPLAPGTKFVYLDILLFLVFLSFCLYFAWNGYDIQAKGYSYSAPDHMVVMAVVLWILLIEAVRRSAGLALMLVVLFFSVYPLFAGYMPGLLEGVQRSLGKTALFHILSDESAMGSLTRIFGNIVFGFIIFGVAVVETGGSDFLLHLSQRIVGKTRGGSAKMAIIASGLFGSVSGSPIANVLTTGSITIPAMKKSGYPSAFAGAVETCASTAGTFTPPIMGATAFVLASFIDVPYSHVAVSAAVPAFLFYLVLFIQVDGHAARHGLGGPERTDAPPLKEVLKDGWFYLPTLLVLIYFLFVLRWTGESPYVATVVMLGLAQIRKKTRFNFKRLIDFTISVSTGAAVLLAIMTGAGMLMGSFSLTGIAATFSRELFMLAGGNIILMLIFTALASLIMGMGMTAIACYIFLALVVAPALVSAGLNELAVHLFVLYCGMLSYITPPVALCAFTAANVAGAPPMKIAMIASRLGGAIYILPFFFVIDPGLLLHGPPGHIIQSVSTAVLAMIFIGSAMEGYLLGVGSLHNIRLGFLLRIIMALSGIVLALPGWKWDMIGLVFGFLSVLPFVLAGQKTDRVAA